MLTGHSFSHRFGLLVCAVLIILGTGAFISPQNQAVCSATQTGTEKFARNLQTNQTFSDDFSDNGNDWDVGRTGGSDIAIQGGEMRLTSFFADNMTTVAVPLDGEAGDFDLAVDVTTNEEELFSYEVWFHVTNEGDDGYMLSVFPALFLINLGIYVDGELLEPDEDSRPTINTSIQPTGTNHIEISVAGDEIDISINGSAAQEFVDSTHAAGGFSLGVSAYSGGASPAAAAFDNLEISYRESSSGGGDGDGSSGGRGLGAAPEGMIENVLTAPGGIEVFPLPSRDSGRVFAAAGTSLFAPHVAGRNAAGDWVYIYYFDESELKAGWTRVRNLVLTEAQVAGLPVIDPNNPPELPSLLFNPDASRPYAPRATPIPDKTPVVRSARFEGNCQGSAIIVDWFDPDGNAVAVDINGIIENIGGGSGTLRSEGWFCDSPVGCLAQITVIDAEGNRSPIFTIRQRC